VNLVEVGSAVSTDAKPRLVCSGRNESNTTRLTSARTLDNLMHAETWAYAGTLQLDATDIAAAVSTRSTQSRSIKLCEH
jgi:hypothetical protein